MKREHLKPKLKTQTVAPPIPILICDDQPLFLLGLRAFLERQDGIRIVAEAGDGESLLLQASRTQPSVILMDMSTARKGEFEIIRQLREICPKARILIITSYANPVDLVAAIQAGALGYLLKESDPSLILRAINTIESGKPWIQRELAEQLFVAINHLTQMSPPVSPAHDLSHREREVLRLVAQGLSNKEIACKLHLSVQTVKVHLSHILRKLKVRNRTEAAQYAINHMTNHQSGL